VDPQRLGAYQKLLGLLTAGSVVPVIGFSQPYEWVRKGLDEGNEIAGVLDLAPACYECCPHSDAFMFEVMAESNRLFPSSALRLPDLMHDIRAGDSAAEFLNARVPSFRAGVNLPTGPHVLHRTFQSARDLVRVSARVSRSDPPANAVYRLYQHAFAQTRSRMSTERFRPKQAIVERLRRHDLLLELIGTVTPAIDVNLLWEGLDIDRCPAIRLWTQFWWRMVQNQGHAHMNDPTDVEMLPVYVYADFSLTERRMCGHVRAADRRLGDRVFREPHDLIDALSAE
jgi:hypothetical protein